VSEGMTSPDTTPEPEDRHSQEPEGLGRMVRRMFMHSPSPEERLEQVLAERRRELAEQAAIVEQTLEDLERREERLRDSKASIERLLRLGERDLDLRESDLVRLGRELTERESRIDEEETELTRRRAELGAVELMRAAVEQRDRALEAREESISEREAALDERAPGHGEDPSDVIPNSTTEALPVLLFVPGPGYRLVEVERAHVSRGESVELDGIEHFVAKVGPSPLPGDPRRCAYLVRGGPERRASAGSS